MQGKYTFNFFVFVFYDDSMIYDKEFTIIKDPAINVSVERYLAKLLLFVGIDLVDG